MDALSSSFLLTRSQLLNIPSLGTKERPQTTKITAKGSPDLTSFTNPIKKLTKHTAQQHDIAIKRFKEPPYSKHEVTVQKSKSQSLLSTIFNSLDAFICNFIDLPLPPYIDPIHVLSGNFAPVDELPPTACEVVEGSLPSCLDGAYIRNGPNPQFTPPGPYHVFDGDGMLHMIKISQGKATFCSRYVKTYKYLVEREMGYPFFPSFFASFNGLGASMARMGLSAARMLTGQFDPITNGFGVANTNVALIGGNLYALSESDLPYAVKVTSDGDIVTLGRHNFQTTEPLLRMTAHPKVDPLTGEAFAYGFNVPHPFLTFFRVDPDGRKSKGVPITSVKDIAAIHDFALTENYAIFPDVQIVFNPLWIVQGRLPQGVDADKVPRVGIITRYAEDDSGMLWIDAPGLNSLHCCNAWEEEDGNSIVMVCCNMVNVEQAVKSLDAAEFRLEKITINVKARTLQRHPLTDEALEMAVINPAYVAKRNRYVYAAVLESKAILGVVKLDLSATTTADGSDYIVASRLHGPGCCGSEPFFVAREPNNPEADEDDGYIVTYLYDEKSNESKFLVMDAKSPTLDIVAVVKLPQRVPHGFHGLFVSVYHQKRRIYVNLHRGCFLQHLLS